jgi:hypothetical protein
MKRTTIAVFSVAALCVCGTAGAGKVSIPKEGKYAIDFCVVGHGKTLSVGDKFFAISYEVDALTRSTPPGGAFDRMGARCYGIYKNVDGTASHSAACELTDLDGDKWWMDVMGVLPDADGGYYKAVGGTGKYEGISLQGEFRSDNNFGSPAKDVAFVGCNPNKGTYKLK